MERTAGMKEGKVFEIFNFEKARVVRVYPKLPKNPDIPIMNGVAKNFLVRNIGTETFTR